MNRKLMLNGLLFLAPCLAPTALASTTWYVDGVNGSDSNNCLAADTACKTIWACDLARCVRRFHNGGRRDIHREPHHPKANELERDWRQRHHDNH